MTDDMEQKILPSMLILYRLTLRKIYSKYERSNNYQYFRREFIEIFQERIHRDISGENS
jgi:hypothetical protein